MKALLTIILFSLPSLNFAALNNATTTADGNITTNSNWAYNTTGTAPTDKDTLYIYHNMYWNADVNWSATNIDVIIIKSGGSIGPDGSNRVLTLPTNVLFIVETGGEINNPSANQSNHGIMFGTVCIWGKHCCSSAGNVVLPGPIKFDIANPCGFIVLPVEIISLNSEVNSNEIKINWTVASESNIDYYNLDRSIDGKTYEFVGTVKAKNIIESQYSYQIIDKSPLPVKSAIYKLTTVEQNAPVMNTNFLSVNFTPKVGILIKDNSLLVNLPDFENTFNVSIYNFQGKELLKSECDNLSKIDLNGIANSGLCILRISLADGTIVETQKILLFSN